jgi:hypothetical protein
MEVVVVEWSGRGKEEGEEGFINPRERRSDHA